MLIKTFKQRIVFSFMCIFFGCSNSSYTEYIPVSLVVEKGNHQLLENPQLLTPEHVEAMKLILARYDEPYKEIDGKLLIKSSLQSDRDLLQNYTFKAEALIKDSSGGWGLAP